MAGHANPNTTLEPYAHVLGESQNIAAIHHLNKSPDATGPHSQADDDALLVEVGVSSDSCV